MSALAAQTQMAANQGQTETATSSNPYDASNSQFAEIVEHLITQVQQLFSLTGEVAKLQKGDRLKFPNGQEIGKREVRSLQSQYIRELRSLRKYHAAAKKPKKNNRQRRPFTGFGMPIYIDEILGKFFDRSELGMALRPKAFDAKGDPTEYENTNQPIKNFLALILKNNITARGMLTPLFNIYVRVNHMPYTDGNRTFLKATPEMYEFFGKDFEKLRQQDEQNPRQETVTVKNPLTGEKEKKKINIPPFNPERFRYSDIMRILSFHWIPTEDLSDKQKQLLENAEVRERLTQEQHLVSDTNACYRAQEAPQRKEQRTARRRTQDVKT